MWNRCGGGAPRFPSDGGLNAAEAEEAPKKSNQRRHYKGKKGNYSGENTRSPKFSAPSSRRPKTRIGRASRRGRPHPPAFWPSIILSASFNISSAIFLFSFLFPSMPIRPSGRKTIGGLVRRRGTRRREAQMEPRRLGGMYKWNRHAVGESVAKANMEPMRRAYKRRQRQMEPIRRTSGRRDGSSYGGTLYITMETCSRRARGAGPGSAVSPLGLGPESPAQTLMRVEEEGARPQPGRRPSPGGRCASRAREPPSSGRS